MRGVILSACLSILVVSSALYAQEHVSTNQNEKAPHQVSETQKETISRDDVPMFFVRENMTSMPHYFRTTQSEFDLSGIDTTGLHTVRAAGCAQFSKDQLPVMLRQLEKDYGVKSQDIYIFDLREESHGFVEGHSISWHFPVTNDANRGMSQAAVLAKEKASLNALQAHSHLSILDKKIKSGVTLYHLISTHKVESEQEVVEGAGAQYIRIPVTDHCAPEPEDVDLFLDAVKKMPPQGVAVLHCLGGWGRTSTFMTFLDMWHNAQTVAFDDIINRQIKIGYNAPLKKFVRLDRQWKIPLAKERYKIIQGFYAYCKDPELRKTLKFSEFWQRYVRSVGSHDGVDE